MTAAPSEFIRVSVVIPAHNEELVIGRCLQSLLKGAEEDEIDVVVVCNGCTDRTAELARNAAPAATVLEIPVASKIAALNAGDEHAKWFPRFYVDADVELPLPALRQTAAALSEPGVLCAAPQPEFALEGRPWAIRAFYDIWQRTPYLRQDMVGTGVYALSEHGRGRFGAFPELTADDQYAQQLFLRGERRSVQGAHFVVHPPFKLRGLLAMRARAYRGNRELADEGLGATERPPSGGGTALRLLLRPGTCPAAAVYLGINMVAKGMARTAKRQRWERDDSARAALSPPGDSAERGQSRHPARVCYVTSHYPAVSHTFVMREVMGVRSAGVEVETVSVHRASAQHLLSDLDREEAARTWSILPLDKAGFLAAHGRAFFGHPGAYLRVLGAALAAAPPGGLRARLWQLFYFAEGIALWGHARKVKARHLHAHLANVAADVCWWASAFGDAAEPGAGWAWSLTMHGSTEFYSTERFNLRRKIPAAAAVICVSEFTRSQLMYLSTPEHWGKLRVVHSGVDLERYPWQPPPERELIGALCVSRLVPGKGLELLVDAISELAGRGTTVELTIVGDGPLEASLRDRGDRLGIAGQLRLVGAVGQDDMPGYYRENDVFCLPSFAEGVPVVLMEAMATGRPVVATRITGVPELVEDGISGLLVVPGSVGELVRALERLAADPELRAEMGMAGRKKVEEAFDARRCAAEAAEVFEQQAGTGRGHDG
ncbi:MAG TPA: glycosyltransferase [Acidimicrobiales bacterium]|nr:glycosyltransferase [Acidimicrobiales bacterium]